MNHWTGRPRTQRSAQCRKQRPWLTALAVWEQMKHSSDNWWETWLQDSVIHVTFTILYCSVLYYTHCPIIQYCTIPHHTKLYYGMLYIIIRNCTVLYCTMLDFTRRYSAISYQQNHITLYYKHTKLHFSCTVLTILNYTALYTTKIYINTLDCTLISLTILCYTKLYSTILV